MVSFQANILTPETPGQLSITTPTEEGGGQHAKYRVLILDGCKICFGEKNQKLKLSCSENLGAYDDVKFLNDYVFGSFRFINAFALKNSTACSALMSCGG